MASTSKITRDHDEIRSWAEARGGRPAHVADTGSRGDIGILRLEFPGAPASNDASLEELSWEQFFDKFDERGLALLYQEETAGGAKSNFNKLVSAETAAAEESGSTRRAASRGRKGAKTATRKAAAKKTSGTKTAAKKADAKRTSRAAASRGTARKASKSASRKSASQPARRTAAKKSSRSTARKSASRGTTKKAAGATTRKSTSRAGAGNRSSTKKKSTRRR